MQSYRRGIRVPRIMVIGVGGAGCNAIDYLVSRGMGNVKLVAANTDAKALARSRCDIKMQLGRSGRGAGSVPTYGRHAAEESRTKIKVALRGSDLVLLVVGLGGGTGTGATHVIARLARKMGIVSIAVLCTPFDFERRDATARRGLEHLRNHCNALVTVSNAAAATQCGDDAGFDEIFRYVDRWMETIIRSLTDTVLVPGLVNLAFADHTNLFMRAGHIAASMAESTGIAGAKSAAEAACVSDPALQSVLSAARRVLVTITASRALQISEVNCIVRTVQAHTRPDAVLSYATITDTDLGDRLRVAILAVPGRRHNRARPHR